jgi:hypothetical protein
VRTYVLSVRLTLSVFESLERVPRTESVMSQPAVPAQLAAAAFPVSSMIGKVSATATAPTRRTLRITPPDASGITTNQTGIYQSN